MSRWVRLVGMASAVAVSAVVATTGPASARLIGPVSIGPSPKCAIYADAETTARALRESCTPAQMDAIYAGLPAGPMPAYDSDSHSYARMAAWTGGLDTPQNWTWEQLWQGQTFYTHQNGGYLMNRVMGYHEQFWAPVFYGPSYVDGKQAIIVTYYHDIFRFIRLELRRVQPGLYFGSSMHSTSGHNRQAYVIEDFVNPKASFTDCPLCAFGL